MTRSACTGHARALTFALAFLLGMSVCAPTALAAQVSVDDYRARVAKAADAVGTARVLSQKDAAYLAAELRRLLPQSEEVRAGDVIVAVSDESMPGLLSELEVAGSADGRSQALDALGGHLASLRTAVGVPGRPLPYDAAALKRLLAGGFEEPTTAASDMIRQWLDRIVRAVLDWLAGVRSTPQGATTVRTVELAVLLGFASVALWLGWRGVRAWRRAAALRDRASVADPAAPVVAAAEGLPADPAAYADSLAAEGRFREAVRALFGGAARSLAERGFVSRTRTRTNAELLAEIEPSAPDVARPLGSLSHAFEVAWYGHRDPGGPGFEAAREAYREALGEAAPSARSRERSSGGDTS
jgi:hypothetical protein